MRTWKRSLLAALVAPSLLLAAGPLPAANKVLKLEGDPESYFEVPDDDSLDLDLGQAFTVEAWVNPEIVVAEHLPFNKEDVYEIGINNGYFQTAVKPVGQGWEWWDSGEEAPVDKWSHVAVTWNGEEISLFFNGEFKAVYLKPGDAANDSPDTFKVGRRTRGGATHSIFTGLIDEVRVSNSIRYTQAGFKVPTTCFTPDANTMALYHFDSQEGTTVRDASSKANDGVLLNDARLVEDNFLSCGAQLAGDFNGNGQLDAADVNQLTREVATNSRNLTFDVTKDGLVNGADLQSWVKDLRKTWVGDANLDGQFNSTDFVSVFQTGKFELNSDAAWTEGDWNADLRFNSSDFVAAFQDGGFEQGPRAAVASVPEPSGMVGACAAALLLPLLRRRQRA